MKPLIILNIEDDVDLSVHLKQFNKCLYITTTHGLRKYRLADKELGQFLHEKDNQILSFQKYRTGILSEVSKNSAYISSGDQLYILCKVIDSYFQEPEKRQAYYNSQRSLFKLYSSLICRDKQLTNRQLELIEADFTPSVLEIFKLYNCFYDRLKSVRNATDELLCFDNKEGDFPTQFDVYKYQQNKFINSFETIILDGFLFLNDYQKQLLFDAAALDKHIVFITRSVDYLKDNFFNLLAKELNLPLQYIDIKSENILSMRDIKRARDNLFTGNKQESLNGFRFIKPFSNRDDEFRFIISDISNKIKAECGQDNEAVFAALNEIAIVLQISPEKNEHFLNEILKETGIFILKKSYCEDKNIVAPKIVYSKQEFLDAEIILDFQRLNIEEKLLHFYRFYERLKVNTKRRSFINYPVGQFITEIYSIIENKGLNVESFNKLLYSNWRYVLKQHDQKYDDLIKDFSLIQAFFSNASALEDWIAIAGNLKASREKILGDYAFKSHPLTDISFESLDSLNSYLKFINSLILRLKSIKGRLSDHVEGLKSLFDINYDIAEDTNEERVIVEELLSAVNDIKASSMLEVDAEFFAANIKNMILDYEKDFDEESDYDLVLKTITLENIAPFKTVYLPMFEAKKYPKQFDDDFPFTADIRKILNDEKYGVGYGLSKYVDRDYFLEIEKYFIKNGLSFAQDEIIFTQSEFDNGQPVSASIYVRDIFSLISSEVKYEEVAPSAPIDTEAISLRHDTYKLKSGEYYLSDILMYYLCPKYCLEASAHKLTFNDDFQLKFYAAGIVYYKFFENIAAKYPDKIFGCDSELIEISKYILKQTIEEAMPYFTFFTRLEKNDIYFSVLADLQRFYEDKLADGKFKADSFTFGLTEPIVLNFDDIRVIIPKRVFIANKKSGLQTEFDISPKIEFLKLFGEGKQYEFKHFDEIIEQLRLNLPDDDRIALIKFAYFKIVTQLTNKRFFNDGVIRIENIINEIKNSENLICAVPSDYCLYCKLKNTCREYYIRG